MITYNGRTLKEIVNNFVPGMNISHKREYLRNCIGVYNRETANIDLIYANQLRNRNHILITFYLQLHITNDKNKYICNND